MNRNVSLFLWGAASLGLFGYAGLCLLRGGYFNYFVAVIMLSPFLFILFLHYRAYWHVMLLLSIPAGRLIIQSYGLEHFTPMMVMSLFLIATFILDHAMHKIDRGSFFSEPADKAALVMAVILTGRLLYDRPGFVGMGSAEGGFFRAFQYVVGTWAFFALQRMAATARFTRRQLQVSVWVVLCLFIYALIRTQLYSVHLFTRAMGEQESWMLVAMLLALISTSPLASARSIRFYGTAFAFLFMAAISTYRGRVLYILGEILAVARHTGRLRRTVLLLAAGGTAGLAFFIAFPRYMPVGMERFASLVTDVDKQGSNVGAYGWQDSFRVELYQIGWRHIRENPVFGKGFGLSVGEALEILAVSSQGGWGREMVALGGHYHNSIVSVAVATGLPAALMFTFVLVSVPLKFGRMLRAQPDGDFRTWGLVIMAFYFGVLGMTLLNGSSREVFYLMIVTGYMMGMMKNPEAVFEKPAPVGHVQPTATGRPIPGSILSART